MKILFSGGLVLAGENRQLRGRRAGRERPYWCNAAYRQIFGLRREKDPCYRHDAHARTDGLSRAAAAKQTQFRITVFNHKKMAGRYVGVQSETTN